jgi:cytochrome c biogenesis protein CcdA
MLSTKIYIRRPLLATLHSHPMPQPPAISYISRAVPFPENGLYRRPPPRDKESNRMKNLISAILILIAPFSLLANSTSSAPSKLVLTFFGSPTCGECVEIRETLLKPLEHQHGDKLTIHYRDVDDTNDMKILNAMENGYKIKSSSPQELFFPDTVLLGKDEIMRYGRALIETALAHPEKWGYRHAYGDKSLDTVSAVQTIRERMKTWSFIGLFAMGFVDGINPCAIATMIFLISFLDTKKRSRSDILKIGLSFTGTVFITYFLIGLGAFRLFAAMQIYRWFNLAITLTAVGIALWVALMSIWDAIHYSRTKDTTDMKVQLPKSVKMLIHAVIRENLSSNRIVIGAVVTGFLVTLLAGVCTAKIYLPTITAMTRTFGFRLEGVLLLFFYNLLFVLPLLIVLTATAYGQNWSKLSKFQQKHMILVKLLLALAMLGLAAYLSIRLR